MLRRAAAHRRQGFQISEQIAQIVESHALIGGVRKSRIKMLAAGRGAFGHSGDEIRLAPGADAILTVRRNIRRIEGSEWRFQRRAATELDRVLLAIAAVAGRTRSSRS